MSYTGLKLVKMKSREINIGYSFSHKSKIFENNLFYKKTVIYLVFCMLISTYFWNNEDDLTDGTTIIKYRMPKYSKPLA